MSARDWTEVILALLLVVNVAVLGGSVAYALRRIGALSARIDAAVVEVQRDTVAALQETHESLTRLSALTDTLNTLITSEITPTMSVTRSALGHVDTTLKGVADATTVVRRIAAGAEALTAPSAMSDAMGRVTQSTAGRMALLAAGAVALLQGVLGVQRARQRTAD